uniref:(northern house mosquito) hypothetical protein n=1 Tax=Culex pipiens TaxID=7175 RepID=A0A8D8HSJ5_CULPI
MRIVRRNRLIVSFAGSGRLIRKSWHLKSCGGMKGSGRRFGTSAGRMTMGTRETFATVAGIRWWSLRYLLNFVGNDRRSFNKKNIFKLMRRSMKWSRFYSLKVRIRKIWTRRSMSCHSLPVLPLRR